MHSLWESDWRNNADVYLARLRDRGGVWLWLVLLLIVLALGGVLLMPVNVHVRIQGEFRPAGDRVEVSLLEGGVVAKVYVEDGDHLAAGQKLVRLERPVAESRLKQVLQQIQQTEDEIEDLRRMRMRLEQGSPDQLDEYGLLQTHRSVDWDRFVARVEGDRVELMALEQEWQRAVRLQKQGVMSLAEKDRIASSRELAQTKLRQTYREFSLQWAAAVDELRRRQWALQHEVEALEETLAAAIIRSPAAGTFVSMNPIVAGQQVLAGQRIGFVSSGDRLIVEAKVMPRQLAGVGPDGKARVSVHALPAMHWGTITAWMESVSADRLPDGTYRLVLSPERDWLQNRDGRKVTIRRGMTTEIRLLSDRRPVWSALLYNASEWWDQGAAVRTNIN
ncbi:MAG: HlyD family secretion protein [Verrucomicrobia bacterium]|nr:HlyD family secretion protein [Verrucomicrobiota bacterium]